METYISLVRGEAAAANDSLNNFRQDTFTAQKIDVGVIIQEMLDTATAAEYLAKNNVPILLALRVLTRSHRKAECQGYIVGT
ncbi:hypothetical protein [Janthinobacterium sp. LB2P70]|uniref:hypothetical protein n=1 Tax=Janthinobacterium sp. LB2P70 TaxID=3424197 RepID=UPI003F2190F4